MKQKCVNSKGNCSLTAGGNRGLVKSNVSTTLFSFKQVMVTLRGMLKHRFSVVFNYQHFTLLWYLCNGMVVQTGPLECLSLFSVMF